MATSEDPCGCRDDELLKVSAPADLTEALGAYPSGYDDVFDEVHRRLVGANAASKLDLAALIAWKHVRNARWMRDLLCIDEASVQRATGSAFAPRLSDRDRLRALRSLPGFGSGGAFASTLFAAWKPGRYGVYDRFAYAGLRNVVRPACTCDVSDLPVYWDHLRRISAQLSRPGDRWTPRKVDMALLNLR